MFFNASYFFFCSGPGILAARHVCKESGDVLDKRKDAYDISKIELAKEMVKRATSKGFKFKNVLGDSWFTCQSIVKFFGDGRRRGHWLSMIKVGGNGRTKYQTEGKSLTAPELTKLGKKQGKQKYSLKLKFYYTVFDATYIGGCHSGCLRPFGLRNLRCNYQPL